MLKSIRKWHKWLGIVLTFFILVFALSGVILNHRDLFSSVDVNRKYLPDNYSYNNWNLAAVKGSVKIGEDSILTFGNTGIWLVNDSMSKFIDFNSGFPKGIDNRKVSSVIKTNDGRLFAATLFGLFCHQNNSWKKIRLPVKEQRIVKLVEKGDSLLVLTRSNLLVSSLSTIDLTFQRVKLPHPADDDNLVGLFRTLWVIHSGEIYGFTGKLIVDFIGIVFSIICITGLVWFFAPSVIKRLKNGNKSRLKKFNRDSLRLHNWLGSWLLPVLILTTITGMFLRPPLLIPIAYTRVEKIKFSELDDPNPWFDRLRDMLYDEAKNKYYFASDRGVYFSEGNLQLPLKPFKFQPPVSVMGITVFEKRADGSILVGSFSGIYRWYPETGEVFDHFTGMKYESNGAESSPFGNLSIAGFIKANENEYLFDYAAGVIRIGNSPPFAEMPENIREKGKISLWNTALEIHTGRFYEPILSKFYILVVPLTGIFTLLILVMGFLSWFIARKRKKKLSESEKTEIIN